MFIVFQTISISFHKSSDSMEVTNLTYILLRTEVYNQSRHDVWGIYFMIDRKSIISPKEPKLYKGKVLPFNHSLLIISDRKPPGIKSAESTCVKIPSSRAYHTQH